MAGILISVEQAAPTMFLSAATETTFTQETGLNCSSTTSVTRLTSLTTAFLEVLWLALILFVESPLPTVFTMGTPSFPVDSLAPLLSVFLEDGLLHCDA